VTLRHVFSSVRRLFVVWVRVDTLKLIREMGKETGGYVYYGGRRRTKLIYCSDAQTHKG
jgi:hypothetical protein